MSFTACVAGLVAADRTGLLGAHGSWERVALAEVCGVLNGFAFKSALFRTSDGMPLIRIRDILHGDTETYYAGDYDPSYLVEHGDLVVGMDGDFNCALWRGRPALLNQRVCKLVPNETYYSRHLLAYALQGYLDAINASTRAKLTRCVKG
jgi:type I restriction enzyme S subunit